jgi:tetratricopeptide (TPR) repeat protein
MPDYYDLGSHTRRVSTASPAAQMWFDRGLIWTYAFNHEEAVRCFERALELDPALAMAHWGVAYAAGPNYNRPWELFDPVTRAGKLSQTYAATQQALALLDHASPAERDLIEAVSARYQAPTEPADFRVWSDAYADAMRAVYRRFPDDLDIAALFAEALLNRTPWQLWNLRTGAPAAGASTLEAVEVLERALEHPAARVHPGVLHMYVHLMEMSPFPERALRAADWLRHLVPDAGHLTHMSTHIDVLCGHYHDVVESNGAAIVADRKFLAREGVMNVYSFYRIHNYHFKLYGALFLGQYQTALEAAEELISTVPEALLRVEIPPMADRLEGHIAHRLHVLVRFGKWQELIETPLPEDQHLYCVTTATAHYAKGVAYAATGRVAEAEEQQRLFEAAVARVPPTRYLHNNTCLDLLGIAREMLAGELEYRRGHYEAAFAHLRHAIALDDGLPYDEPWGWMQPTRHALGALLLEQDRVEEAEAVYRADLGLDGTLPRAFQHPENLWSLHGYHECLTRLGKHDLARMIGQRLELARARADVPVHASCYCRLTHAA